MKRRHRIAARARAIGASARKGIGSTLADGGIGAVGFFAQSFAAQKWPGMVGGWSGYAPGAILLVGGHLIKRSKFSRFGSAMCGAAGYALGQNFQTQRMLAAQRAANPTALPAGAGAVGYGRDLTGAVGRGRDLTAAVDDAYGVGAADDETGDLVEVGDVLETGAVSPWDSMAMG